MSERIRLEKTSSPKAKPDFNKLGFGNHFTDHMFIMDYTEGKGWHDPRIVPYQNLCLDPATMVFHYGQAIFEGLKAYKAVDGRILLFRPEQNMRRINISNERMCIPPIDEGFAVEAVKELVKVDKDWIPDAEGTSLYIRPFIIATDPYLGVRPSLTYQFIIILSPVGAYYPEGINPVKIYVETNYVRAVKGGVGYAKTPGNYAASLKAQVEAHEKGYTQVLWLDGVERKYIEEVGTMNVFFKIAGEVITPALQGSILPGITRDSTIQLLKSWNVPVTERRISIEEVYEAHKKGLLEEVFGTGTAAVISPVGELNWNENIITVNEGKTGELSAKIYETITGIQYGRIEDKFSWTMEVK
ncbi:branched-chain amino acid aminotransferase [Thermosyntropha sp.]|uniref:branched-chain amino acid aminotransferase n=1 Tax=Thermosyntropha sp. TaxID=2740820 RepID=UPI0025E41A87|nr:branched-chain amino acid aminotransferase [Thermosyntropha sp.]MBO8158962.1 branched-chain amino acid aminotransferase [Thermosyntropha sp.]